MLPIPFINFIPQSFERDAKLIAFADKMDEILLSLKADILGLSSFIDVVKIPAQFLNELGYILSAGIVQTDTERQKRKKIADAIAGHKKRGSWVNDAKPKVDIICGGDSQIVRSFDKDDWILVGDGLTPASFYWSALGADGIDDDLGISLIGSGYEIEVAGNVFIDIDNPALSAANQAILEDAMLEIVPAYMYVHFGFLTGTVWTEYFVME